MLKALEITGFKSFVKKTELQFKSKITAIVGPNGSGKSNVAEAFRFALGEQSIKSMRGKRGEDLIWNGSPEIARSNRALVKLVFNNTDKLFSLDFDEVSIEREVGRDGENKYSINGSAVRLKDVLELMSEAHIGASGHQVISQGEADRILRASLKERREMIEDALGLKIYQYKREESEKKLAKTEENIKQVESLRKEIAPHIKFLKRQAEKVEKAEDLRQKLSSIYKEYLKRESTYIDLEKSRIERSQKPLKDEANTLEERMEKARETLNLSSDKDGKSERLLKIEEEIKKEREGRDNLYREIGKAEGEITANKRSLEKAEREQKSEENKMVALSEIEELERGVSVLSEISAILQKIRDFIHKHKHTFDERRLEELKRLEEDLAIKKAGLESKIEDSNNALFELSSRYQKIKDEIEKDKDSGREAEREIFKISAEQNEIRLKLTTLETEEKRIREREEFWKEEAKEAGILLGTAILGFENFEVAGLNEEKEEINKSGLSENILRKQEERRRELEKMKFRLEELGGADSAEIMKEYRDITERDAHLENELSDLYKSIESLEKLIDELGQKLDNEFKQGIEKINHSFQEFFSLMFGGGTAELKIERLKIKKSKHLFDPTLESEVNSAEFDETLSAQEDDGNQEGIEISVSLPKKRVKNLEMLSGGERALTSIALLFAISRVNPPPFIILDETDAALDESNSKKYGDMIESLSKTSDLILITHNRETMSRAGVIYGVTMGKDGASRLLSIAFDEAVAVAK